MMDVATGGSGCSGGLDIGGTKIEARLFGPDMAPLASHRVPTPRCAIAPFMDALAGQIDWLRAQGGAGLPIGISLAGIVAPGTGIATAANLPISGQDIVSLVAQRAGGIVPILNDCMALAYSEANGGAADGASVSVGLVLGTGVAAGVCHGPDLAPRHGGIAVEIGHIGIPARALARHGLPLWRCGCGRDGCFEGYVSGTGLSRLAGHAGLRAETQTDGSLDAGLDAAALVARRDPAAAAVLKVWTDLTGECLDVLQLALAPQVIVLGGGLSRMPGITDRLHAALDGRLLPGVARPHIRVARHTDASGVRGVALFARTLAQRGVQWTV